jgi:hypothetical protein
VLVQLLKSPDVGVPNIGVVNVGDVDRTNVPVPVVDAHDASVPLVVKYLPLLFVCTGKNLL